MFSWVEFFGSFSIEANKSHKKNELKVYCDYCLFNAKSFFMFFAVFNIYLSTVFTSFNYSRLTKLPVHCLMIEYFI